jgi:hypothetical protein
MMRKPKVDLEMALFQADLLQSVRTMKAGTFARSTQVPVTEASQARPKMDLPPPQFAKPNCWECRYAPCKSGSRAARNLRVLRKRCCAWRCKHRRPCLTGLKWVSVKSHGTQVTNQLLLIQ